ncbi:MAG: ferredoxin family protein [Anaerolineae bacterium]|nr:ferredoxin family protein [Anaerolineae bacterium]
MTRIITSLCVREGACATVCPVECIVAGKPEDKYPWYYIDAETCIDCGACESECPVGAIFPEDEVPSAFKAKGGETQSMPVGTAGFTTVYEGKNHDGEAVHLEATKVLAAGDVVDLTPAIQANNDFFKSGPGYNAK